MTFPRRAAAGEWPVAVNGTRGAGDILAARSAGPGRVEFVYTFEGLGQRPILGTPFSVVAGRSYLVDVVFDALVHQVIVQVDGQSVLSAELVRPNRPIFLGSDPLGGPTLARFPGRVTPVVVATPTCDALLARLERSP